jgi:hypothetical protein
MADTPGKSKKPQARFKHLPEPPKHEFVRGARLSITDEEAAAQFGEIEDTRKRLYLAAIAKMPRFGKAARAAGIDAGTGWMWRNDKSDVLFQAAFERAYKLGVEAMESEFIRRGFEGYEKPVYHQGKLVGTTREFDTTAGIVMLKAVAPERHRERVAVEHAGSLSGTVNHVHIHAQLPPEEVARRLKQFGAVIEAPKPVHEPPDTLPVIDTRAVPVETAEEAYARRLAEARLDDTDNPVKKQ